MEKVCTSCNVSKDLLGFYPHPAHRLGVTTSCRLCICARNKAYYHRSLKGDPFHTARAKASNREWYKQNIERHQAKAKRNHRLEREACFAHYGRACACCGEHRYEFLSLDHINGGGRQHAKETGSKLARWLVRKGFPAGFRTLCHNCNQSLGHYGYCPHENSVKKGAA